MTWDLKGQELNQSSSDIPSALHVIHREDFIYINTYLLHNTQRCVDGPCREMDGRVGCDAGWGRRLGANG